MEFKCSTQDCSESFVSKQMLVRHVKDKHTTVTCEHCQKEVRKSYLKKHVRSVHSLEDQTMCHLCGKVSNTKEAHNVHYITEHSDQNGVQCDICKTWLVDLSCPSFLTPDREKRLGIYLKPIDLKLLFIPQVQKQADHSDAFFVSPQTEASHLSNMRKIIAKQKGVDRAQTHTSRGLQGALQMSDL